ncbi:TIGR04348 family glycosyltransferase [Massilia eurypsychrophila]|uniref:TIGR04348 family glycosyltransferase n=1 Tax=Massilia eurypsychrophila TaxID=1485217 RepID=A0A2G8TA79_9BURK|nr:TIGR04348 family glycosyltransferase [Massilia eurypsychrophila]
MAAKHVIIVSPALARANNGNWQTASRWAQFLRAHYRVDIVTEWTAADGAPDLLIALHARRAAPSLAAFTQAHPERPSILVLTGTDLYRDIATDGQAQQSLLHARALVLLQDAGLALLPAALRGKAHVIYQSAPALAPYCHPAQRRGFSISMVGHLRDEKDPLTFIAAAALVSDARAHMVHIGGALEPALGAAAEAAQASNPRYRWLGNLDHGAAREQLRRSHAMVIASRMEGGANVIIEAVTCGVPVLASDISGNRGMLGDDYEGYFSVGDAPALARLIERSIADADFYRRLRAQCATRAVLFDPAAEKAALLALVDNLSDTHQ